MRLSEVYSFIRYGVPHFIKNVYTYRKALWDTYNFDYSGSLHYLQIHLEQLEPAIRNGHHLYGEKTADKVKVCRLLIERILNNSEQYSIYDLDIDFSERKFKIQHIPKNTEHPRYGSRLYMDISKNREQQDWDLLFKMLHKHMRGFWD